MKKMLILAGILILLFLCFPGSAPAGELIKGISFKLNGGLGTWSGSDLNDFFNDFNLKTEHFKNAFGGSVKGDIERLNFGPEFEGELVFHLPKNFAVSLGLGYLYRKNESGSEMMLVSGLFQSVTIRPKFTAVPITLNGYYYLPIAGNVDVYFKAGIGYYLGKSTYEIREESGVGGLASYWESDRGTASSNALGFQGGIGLEYAFSKSVSLFIEGHGRYARLEGWTGDNRFSNFFGETESTPVEWFYYEEQNPVTQKSYKNLFVSDKAPAGPDVTNVRKANISYSGISLRFGVKISFGKR